MNHFLFALLFFLPAGFANAAPPIANKIPLLNRWKTPIDFGNTVRGKRALGKNKTWRGLVFGTLIGGVSAWLLFPHIGGDTGTDIEHFLIGSSIGFGALLGDAIESFFKRQRGIASGNAWLGFDQLDYVVGAILFSLPFIRFSLAEYAVVVVTFLGLHFVVSYFGYLLGFKDKPI
ncbi:CDP-archaeol synthase [Candidatus Saccharibacteria bacterium]|nr:MAG: CDP-archaeol synthase [Candidatus Saccharibacteria bacterium]